MGNNGHGNIHDLKISQNVQGDRIPTRERQYRVAHQNVRRREITRQQQIPYNMTAG